MGEYWVATSSRKLAVGFYVLGPEFKILPNHSADAIRIIAETAWDHLEVVIYDLSGRKIYRNDHSSGCQLDIPISLNSGVYLLCLNSGGEVESIKLIRN